MASRKGERERSSHPMRQKREGREMEIVRKREGYNRICFSAVVHRKLSSLPTSMQVEGTRLEGIDFLTNRFEPEAHRREGAPIKGS